MLLENHLTLDDYLPYYSRTSPIVNISTVRRHRYSGSGGLISRSRKTKTSINTLQLQSLSMISEQ